VEGAMVDYRVFYLDPTGHVCEGAELTCEDEAEAIRIFDEYSLGRPMELWHLNRRVKAYSPQFE